MGDEEPLELAGWLTSTSSCIFFLWVTFINKVLLNFAHLLWGDGVAYYKSYILYSTTSIMHIFHFDMISLAAHGQ